MYGGKIFVNYLFFMVILLKIVNNSLVFLLRKKLCFFTRSRRRRYLFFFDIDFFLRRGTRSLVFGGVRGGGWWRNWCVGLRLVGRFGRDCRWSVFGVFGFFRCLVRLSSSYFLLGCVWFLGLSISIKCLNWIFRKVNERVE